jgi:hypothetical protein
MSLCCHHLNASLVTLLSASKRQQPQANRNQEVLGTVHQLVSVIREGPETAATKLAEKRTEDTDILRT